MTETYQIYDFKIHGTCYDISNSLNLYFIHPLSIYTNVFYDRRPKQSSLIPCSSEPSLFFNHENGEELGGMKISFATIPGRVYHVCAMGQLLQGDSVQMLVENTCLSNFRLHQPVFFNSDTSLRVKDVHLCFKAIDDTTTLYFQNNPQGDCSSKIYRFRLTSLQVAPDSVIFPGIPLITGFIGVQGPQGPVGATGPLEFPNAPTGPQGPPSIPGIQPQGSIGPQGPDATEEELITPGPDGPPGPFGPDNPENPVGPQGPGNSQIGPAGPQGPQGDQGQIGIPGLPGISFINPVPTKTEISLSFATNNMILLNVLPSNPITATFERHSGQINIILPEFTFNQNLNPSTTPYILTAFLPTSIRPSRTYNEPILFSDGTIGLLRIGLTTIQINNGINDADLFPVNQTFTIAPNQSFRYLL